MKIIIEHNKNVFTGNRITTEFNNVPTSVGQGIEQILKGLSVLDYQEKEETFPVLDGKVDQNGNPIFGLDYWG